MTAQDMPNFKLFDSWKFEACPDLKNQTFPANCDTTPKDDKNAHSKLLEENTGNWRDLRITQIEDSITLWSLFAQFKT
jgi:hypothetical protein